MKEIVGMIDLISQSIIPAKGREPKRRAWQTTEVRVHRRRHSLHFRYQVCW